MTHITVDRERIANFCRRHNIQKLSFFGSVVRDDFTPESDIDVLVEFAPGCTPGFFGIVDMQEELSRVLGGRAVDLRTPEDLSRYFRDDVLAHAEVHYVA